MRLNKDEYMIKGDSIIIKKEALESWRDHYDSVAEEVVPLETKAHYYGKRDVFIDLLKHFDTEELDFI